MAVITLVIGQGCRIVGVVVGCFTGHRPGPDRPHPPPLFPPPPPPPKGSALGTAAVTVMDKSVDMIAAIRRLSHFYRCAEKALLCSSLLLSSPCHAIAMPLIMFPTHARWMGVVCAHPFP